MKAITFMLAATLLASIAFLQPALAEGMRQTSSGGSLDVVLEPEWAQNGPAQFKVSFLQSGTDTVQVHVDFDLKVVDGDGNQVFSAAGLLGFPTLHTAEGVVTIPYKFEENDNYNIIVEMTGIQFVPITPETAEFSVNVTPEFPTSALSVVAAVAAGTIVVARMKKP